MKVIDTSDWFIEAVGAIPGIHTFPSQGNSVPLDCEGSGKTVEAFKQELLLKGYLSRNLSGGRDVRGENFLRIMIERYEDMEQVAAVLSALKKHR